MSPAWKSLRVMPLITGILCGLSCWRPLDGAEPVPFITPIEFQSYGVEIRLQGAERSRPTDQLVARVRPELEEWVARAVGPLWQVEWPTDEATLNRPAKLPDTTETAATPTDASSSLQENPTVPRTVDVRYRIELTQKTGQIQARVSSEEPTWSHQSPVIEWQTADERELSAALVKAMARLFRPQATWERLEESQVQLRIRGAGLAVPDSSLNLLRTDEIFEPHFVFRDRAGILQREVRIPLTLCVLKEHTAGRGVAEVVSGLRNPLASRPRGRVEHIAVASRPQWPSTTLELKALSQPPRRLVAHEVHLTQGGLPKEKIPAPIKRISNRQGEVQLAADPTQRWVMATIFSGDQTLAIVPVVAGAQPRISLDLPDDLLRLRVEGQLRLLQGELVAVVAERTALMLAARASSKRRAWPEVDERLKEILALPTAAQFRERVSAVRVPAVSLAREQKDKLAERRVERMCNEAEELIRRYLLDDKVKLLQEEMTELKSVAAEANSD